jgi:putative ABC transport system substrate-binding protein
MRRRDFITLVSGSRAAWPLAARAAAGAARAQQQVMPVIGFLSSSTPAGLAYLTAAFRQGLSEASYVEGRNVAIEYRWAESRYDRLHALAAYLVRRQVAMIAALGPPSTLVARAVTRPFRSFARPAAVATSGSMPFGMAGRSPSS